MLKYLMQLFSESMVYGLSGVVTRFITIFLVPLYTRALMPEDYGVMSLIRNSTTILAVIACLSLDSAAQRFYWDTDKDEDRKSALTCWAWSWLTLGGLAVIVVFMFADELAFKIAGTTAAATSLKLAVWTVPLGVLGIVYMNLLRIQRRPWAVTAFTLITAFATIALAVVFVLVLEQGVHGVFISQFIVALATTLALAPTLIPWIHPRYFDWKRLKSMLSYSVPLLPAVVSFWAIDVIDRYFLKAYTTTAQVGLYDIGYSIAAVVALGTTAFQQAWLPFALSIQGENDARNVYAQTLTAYTWMGSLACVGATLFAPEALRILTTEAYYGADTVVAYLSFSYLLMGVVYIATLGVYLKKQTAPIGIAAMAAAALNIVLNFWLVPRYGMKGAALATLISYSLIPAYLFYRSQKLYPIPYRFGRSILIILFSVALIQVGSSWSFTSVFSAILAKLGLLSLFVPLLFVLRIASITDLRQMYRRMAWPLRETKAVQAD